MAITYVPPASGGGFGNLATAMGLYDQFLGLGHDMRQQQLTNEQQQFKVGQQALKNSQQQYDITGAAEKRAQELHAPTLAQANAQADILKNTLAKSNTDEATRKGGIEAFSNAPATMMKPTTAMSPEERDAWTAHAQKHGVADLGTYASVWNRAVANLTGEANLPSGAIPTGVQNTGGENTVTGVMVPKNMENLFNGAFGVTPPAAPAAPAPGAPATVPPILSVPVQPPAQGSAPALAAAPSSAAPALPNMQSLLPIAANPFTRAIAENAIKMQNDLAANEEKRQQLEKGQRDVAFGTPEERKSESEFIRNAAQLSHRLEQYKRVVSGPFVDSDGKPSKDGVGNWEWMNPSGAAMLNSLPLDISDNWTKITNPGGVLREGLVHLGKELQIPTANDHWYGALGIGPRNDTTLKGIDQTENVLADYIRQYENLPTTKQPVLGLSPALRQKVGPTRFGKPEDLATEETKMPWEGASTVDFKDLASFQAASQAGNVAIDKPVKIAGEVWIPGPKGWQRQGNTASSPSTNAAPSSASNPKAQAAKKAERLQLSPSDIWGLRLYQ